MSALWPLWDLLERNLQPVGRAIWLGLDCKPDQRNLIVLDSANMPTDADFRAVAGLDVTLCYRGKGMRTSTLRRLCATLKRALPRQLLLVDLDAEHAGATKAAPVAKPRVLRVFQARVLTQPAPVRMRPSAAAWIAMFGDLGRLVDEYVERTPDARARLLNVCNVPHLGDTQTLVYWLRAQLAVVREREANRRAAMEKKRGKS